MLYLRRLSNFIGDLPDGWQAQMASILKNDQGQLVVADLIVFNFLLCLRIFLNIKPPVGYQVTAQVILYEVRMRRKLVPHQFYSLKFRNVVVLPVVQKIIQYRVELLLRRVPGLHQVIVQPNIVNGFYGCFGIGVSGEQHSFGIGEYFDRLFQESRSVHFGHALVAHKQGNNVRAVF